MDPRPLAAERRPPAADARDITVRSFDGTSIRAHFNPASKRASNERLPTVLVGPGYPSRRHEPRRRHERPDRPDTLRAEGYNTLTGTRAASARRAGS